MRRVADSEVAICSELARATATLLAGPAKRPAAPHRHLMMVRCSPFCVCIRSHRSTALLVCYLRAPYMHFAATTLANLDLAKDQPPRFSIRTNLPRHRLDFLPTFIV